MMRIGPVLSNHAFAIRPGYQYQGWTVQFVSYETDDDSAITQVWTHESRRVGQRKREYRHNRWNPLDKVE